MSLLIITTSCIRDFDEILDTDQRYVEFAFDTEGVFDNVLYYDTSDKDVTIDSKNDSYRIRVTGYCYDSNDSLLFSKTVLAEDMITPNIKMRHLNKEEVYRFVFLSDVVKYDPYVGYYETWYYMSPEKLSEFYIFSESRNDDAVYNVVGTSSFSLIPSNQTVEVEFSPITYNGYCVFQNLTQVDRLSGYVKYCNAFKFNTLSWLRTAGVEFNYSYINNESIIKPVSLSYADSLISVKLRKTTLLTIDSLYVDIYNPDRKHFVAVFDCDKMQLSSYEFY